MVDIIKKKDITMVTIQLKNGVVKAYDSSIIKNEFFKGFLKIKHCFHCGYDEKAIKTKDGYKCSKCGWAIEE